MDITIEEKYIACGCNKTPHAADWGPHGKICFAAKNSVALCHTSVSC